MPEGPDAGEGQALPESELADEPRQRTTLSASTDPQGPLATFHQTLLVRSADLVKPGTSAPDLARRHY